MLKMQNDEKVKFNNDDNCVGDVFAIPDLVHDDEEGHGRVLPVPKAPDGLVREGLVDEATHGDAV